MKRLITLATLSLFAVGAQADGAFNHLDITYVMSSADAFDDDGTGIGVEFNTTLGESIFFNVEHSAREFEVSGAGGTADVDFKNTDVGLGYALHLGEDGRLSPYLAVALTEVETSALISTDTAAGLASGSLDGYSLAAGARYALNDRLDLGVRYRTFKFNEDNAEDETAIRLDAAYALTPKFGLVLRFEQFDENEIDDIHFGVRAIFGGGSDD